MKGDGYMIGNFSEEAQNVLLNAKEEMIDLGHPYIGTEHLLLSILKNSSYMSDRLNSYGLTYENFKSELCKIVGTTNRKNEYFLYTPLLRRVIENSVVDSKENNDNEVGVEHLIFSMLEEGEGIAIRILIGMGIDVERMYDEFSFSLIRKGKKDKKKKLLIYDLGTDITNEAKEGKLDPVIGRDKEVRRVMEILCRRGKNNPILIGEAGVGKTAIVEELSRLIASNNVPNNLINKKIISLEMASMVAGTKYRGEFEERMKKVIKEVEDNDEIILFIDEIHTLVGAGGAEGAIDASNILKPALARGKIRCIGATTTEEYKKFIEKDSALERRFQKVFVDEPSIVETENILNRLKPIYEEYHNVTISSAMIKNIINLSEKYIFDRNRPDKEIDILDEVCSRVGLKENKNVTDIRNIKGQIKKLREEKNSYIIENNIDKAYEIRKKETKLMSSLNKMELSKRESRNVVNIDDLALVISSRSNIPVYELMSNSLEGINVIEEKLKKEIIGQDSIIDSLMEMTKQIRFGANNRCYSCLFIGSSGVGKSNLAKLYAKYLVGEDNFIRLDMSEYSDSTSVNKILGSSPGYVGYDDNKNILEEIRNKPNCVLLLDEIDKASTSVINLLYQILEEGKIKNSKGTIVRFDNVVVLMTSNVGFEKNGIGFNYSSSSSSVYNSLKSSFSNSFINRIDNVLSFNKLSYDNIKTICINKLEILKNKYNNIDISYTDNVIDEIINKTNYDDFGARKIDKLINKYIENRIIDNIINNKESVKIESLNDNKKISQI